MGTTHMRPVEPSGDGFHADAAGTSPDTKTEPLTGGLTGGCFCGAVRYEADRLFDAGYCHCSACRRISGAPAAAWFSVREEEFRVTRGQPAALRSSGHFVRYFCAACGTHVHGVDDLPPPPTVGSRLVSAMLGTLDRSDLVAPRLHQWWSARSPWYANGFALPTFETGLIPHPDRRADG